MDFCWGVFTIESVFLETGTFRSPENYRQIQKAFKDLVKITYLSNQSTITQILKPLIN
jgi:hypothetical protein